MIQVMLCDTKLECGHVSHMVQVYPLPDLSHHTSPMMFIFNLFKNQVH